MTLITRPMAASPTYFYFHDDAGNTIDPRQYIIGGNNFKKLSQEVRIASPADNRFRVIAGAFYQRQSNDICRSIMSTILPPTCRSMAARDCSG